MPRTLLGISPLNWVGSWNICENRGGREEKSTWNAVVLSLGVTSEAGRF